ncbi:N-acetyltransferase [Paenibacillus solani]|uniref:N-acetyltransferase n=1 Tax=Paenibacillus solani TaxID=1705565 RepID=UPI003D2C89DC
MIIRLMNDQDMNNIIDIWLTTSIDAHHFIPAQYWQSKIEEMRNVYLPMAETYLLEDDGQVFGFISLVEDHLAALFVSTTSQNQGYGGALLHHAMDLRNVLKLQVYEENRNAFHFYLKNGFQVLEEAVDSNTGQKELNMIWNKELKPL